MSILKTSKSATLRICILLLFSILIFGAAYAKPKPEWKPVLTWYPGGTLMMKGQELNGLKQGRWEYFTEKGKLEKREKWHKGKMKWAIYYNERGKKVRLINAEGKETKLKGCGC